MKFGACGLIDSIKDVEKVGFDYLETSVTKLYDLSESEFTEKLKIVSDSGINVESFNVLFPKSFCLLDGTTSWQEVEDYLNKAFERINRLSGEVVVFGSGKSRSCMPGMSFDKGHRRLVDVASKTGEIAKKYDIKIAIEPLNTSECNTVNTVAEGAILRADIDMENVGLLADSYHMFREDERIDNINRVGYLSHVHVAALEGRSYPTKEDDMLKAFFEALKDINYDGRVSIEGKTSDFATDAPLALSVLKKLSGK